MIATSNADLPSEEQIPLLVIDVWEHAYYMDYQYRRAAYVAAIIDHALNWEFANERLLLADEDKPCTAVASRHDRPLTSCDLARAHDRQP